MPTTIDKKIVEMRFNNADFERNAAKSMQTVDKLKKSMRFDDSGDSLARIAKSIETIEARFSTLGIVGKRVIENITDSVINLEKRFTSFIVNGVRSGGINRAMNLENARFTMQGLLKDEQKVSAVMSAVNASVDGTAYSLDQAATIAAQFVASGKQADEIEGALKGVAGAAAVTNSDFSSMGRIFAQVAGQGRLMGNDLLQLSTRGLNAAATLSDFFNAINSGDESVAKVSEEVKEMVKSISGGAQQTEATIRDLVGKGQMNFDIFAAAMNNAFADQAAKANDTFSGSMSNIKAALARIGADFVSPLIKQKGPFVKFFNTVREKVNELKGVLTTSTDMGNYLSPAASFVKLVTTAITKLEFKVRKLDFNKIVRPMYDIMWSIRNVHLAIQDVIRIGKNAFSDIFPKTTVGKTIRTIISNVEQLTRKLRPSAETTDRLSRIFKGLFSLIKVGITAVKSFIKVFGPGIAGAFKIGVDSALEFAARIGDAITKVQEWLTKTKAFERAFKIIHVIFGTLVDLVVWIGDKIGSVFDWVVSKADKFRVDLGQGIGHAFWELLKGIGESIWNLGKSIKNSIADLFDGASMSGPLSGIKTFLTALKDTFANNPVFDFIIGLFKSLKAGIEKVIGGFKTIKLDGVSGFMDKLRDKFSWLDNLIEFFKAVGRVIKFAATIIIDIIKSVGHSIAAALDSVLPGITDTLNALVGGKGSDLALFGGGALVGGAGVLTIIEIIKKIKKAFSDAAGIGEVVDKFNGILTAIGDTLKAFQMKLKAEALKSIAVSIVMMAGSLVVLSLIPADALGKAIVALTALVANLVYAMKAFSQLKTPEKASDKKKGPLGFLTSLSDSALTTAGQLLLVAGAIGVLTGVILALGLMPYEMLAKGIVTITILLRVISQEVTNIGKAATDGAKGAGVILALAFALNAMILPMLILGGLLKLSPGLVIAGAVAIVLIMAAIGTIVSAIAKLTKEANPQAMKSAAIMIGIIGAAVTGIVFAMSGLMLALSGFSGNVGGKYAGVSVASGGAERMVYAVIAVLAVIGDLFLTAYAVVKMSKQVDPKQLTSVTILFGAIGAISVGLIYIMSKLASIKGAGLLPALAALGGVNKILKTMTKMFESIAKIQAKAKGAEKAVKSMAVSALILSTSIAIITGCIVAITKVGAGKALKAAGIVALVLGALVGITVVLSKIKMVQSGAITLAIILGTIAGVAVAFAAAVWLIIDSMTSFADISSKQIGRIIENVEQLAQGIINITPTLAKAVGALVGGIILTILETIGNAKLAFIRALLDTINSVLTELANNAPSIASNLSKIIISLVDALGPKLYIIADKVVGFVAKMIMAVAKAIGKHKNTIINAIDKLLTEISEVVAGVVGKIIGLEGKRLQRFIDATAGKLKVIVGLMTALKAIAPIKKLIKSVGPDNNSTGALKIIKMIKNEYSALGDTGWTASQKLVASMGTVSESTTGVFSTIIGKASELLMYLGPHGLIAVGALAAGSAVALGFKKLVDDMPVVIKGHMEQMAALEENLAKKHEKVMNSLNESQAARKEDLERLRKEMFDNAIPSSETYISKLEEVFDAHGRVKKGMEDEAATIVNELNPQLDNMLSYEDGILRMNDRRVNSYKELEGEIDNYVQKLKAQQVVEKYADQYKENDERLRELQTEKKDLEAKDYSSELYTELSKYGVNTDLSTDQIEARINEAQAIIQKNSKSTVAGLKASSEDTYNRLKSLLTDLGSESLLNKSGALFTIFGKNGNLAFQNLDLLLKMYTKATGETQTKLDKVNQEISELDNAMDQYENLSDAAMKGEWEKVDYYTTMIEYDLKDRTHANAAELEQQYKDASTNADDMVELAKDKSARIREEERKGAIESLKITETLWKAEAERQGASKEELKAIEQVTNDRIKALEKIETVGDVTFTDDWFGDMKDKLADKIKSPFSDLPDETTKDGKNTGLGFSNGVLSSAGTVNDSMDALASGADDTLRKYYQIESPSKLFAKYGAYIVQGLANGITGNTQLAVNAIQRMAALTLLGMSSTLANQGKVGIKPIVDLSAIQNGSIQGMLNGQALALNGNVSSQIAASINSTEFEAQMDRISDQLAAMHNDMITIGNYTNKGLSQLGTTINGMKVVMNTGALVGQIAAPMDTALGNRAILKKRGI